MGDGRRRGQPLIAMASLVVGYAVLRTAFWQPLLAPASHAPPRAEEPQPIPPVGGLAQSASPQSFAGRAGEPRSEPSNAGGGLPWRAAFALPFGSSPPRQQHSAGPRNGVLRAGLPEIAPIRQRPGPGSPDTISPFPIARPLRPDGGARGGKTNRFAFDTWVFWRDGPSDSIGTGPAFATYGASQAGAVLRYSLAPEDRKNPELYVRISTALQGPPQRDLAAGFSIRPVAELPVRFHAEARLSRGGRGTELRPALFATAGFVKELEPLAVSARFYAQTGFVGGRAETAFADGQLVAERAVVSGERGTLTIGAGVWGGAQRGATRLDAGPSASVSFRLGDAPLRLTGDYRFRIAGDAEPGSGPAVTLSAGF